MNIYEETGRLLAIDGLAKSAREKFNSDDMPYIVEIAKRLFITPGDVEEVHPSLKETLQALKTIKTQIEALPKRARSYANQIAIDSLGLTVFIELLDRFESRE